MLRTAVIAFAAVAAIATPLAAQQAVSSDPIFLAKLKTALKENPEIVIEAARAAQEQAHTAQLQQQEKRVAALRGVLFAYPSVGPVIGNPKGTKTVVEMLDYACPFCKQAHVGVNTIAASDKEARFIILMRPVLGPQSETLARFALAAQMQGKFAKTHDALYDVFGDDHKTPTTDANLQKVATLAGLDFYRAKIDMVSDTVSQQIIKQGAYGDQLGVSGTPFFITAKRVIPGAANEQQLRSAIEEK